MITALGPEDENGNSTLDPKLECVWMLLIYLACLSRYPTEAERVQLLALLPPPGEPSEAEVVEDMFWGMMSSREFLFNH